jgi:hypothetical protein
VWTTADYLREFVGGRDQMTEKAEWIFGRVWRCDFTAPGFCLLDFGPGTHSHDLRSTMVALKERLSEIAARETGERFIIRSMGRFDQQETTKFHLDGAPAASLLLLGYEPSAVRSRLFLADYSRNAFDLGIEPAQFLKQYNPMFRQGEDALRRYITELPQPAGGHSRILLINNSSLPFSEHRSNPLGVMHKAEIINPLDSERRIVNSIMLAVGEDDSIGSEQQREFVTTEGISPKNY